MGCKESRGVSSSAAAAADDVKQVNHSNHDDARDDAKKQGDNSLTVDSFAPRLRIGFNIFDQDGDGNITSDELRMVITAILKNQQRHSMHHHDHIVNDGFDDDHKIHHFAKDSDDDIVTDAQIRDLISIVDYNHDGQIQISEFNDLLGRMLLRAVRTQTEIVELETMKSDRMVDLQHRLTHSRGRYREEQQLIRKIAVLVVVKEEIEPILSELGGRLDEGLTEQFLSLAKVFYARSDDMELFVLQFADSIEYMRHYSGYTQSAAICSLATKVLEPDLFVSFGTAGGRVGAVEVGDVVIASGCVFIDRIRTSSKRAFDWGVFGGPTLKTERMNHDLCLKEMLIGSCESYDVSEVQYRLMDLLNISVLDMEAAPEAQILMQTRREFVAIKVVSNHIYPGKGDKMEKEYMEHKSEVSAIAAKTLRNVVLYLKGKTIGEL